MSTDSPSSHHPIGRVLVTGGAGFIGANLCRALRAAELVTELRVIDDLSTGSASNLDGIAVSFTEGSILDPDHLAAAVRGVDAVVHLAARPSVARSMEDPLASHEANATGTLRVLEAARQASVSQVVVASSSSVYGRDPRLPAGEDAAPAPASPYAASKLATEAYALAYGRSMGLPVLVFRFFNVFGPLQRADHAYAAVVPAFMGAALDDRPLPIHGDGTQTRDFTFVGSVVTVVIDALSRRVTADGPVNLAFGGRCSLNELVHHLEVVIGRSLPVTHLPSRPGDVPHSQADRRRLAGLFPEAEAVPLPEALRQTLEWTRQNR